MAFKVAGDKRAKAGGKDLGRIEDGTYVARFVQLIDLGDQEQIDFSTKESKGWARELWWTFEFPTERIEVNEEDRPRWLSKAVKFSTHEKSTMTAWLKALDPKGTAKTLDELIGRSVMVEVGSTSGDKAKITNVMKVMKGVKVGELENEPDTFDMDEPDMAVFDKLPDFLKERIKEAQNFPNSALAIELNKRGEDTGASEDNAEEADEPDFDDDIPFDEDE